MFNRGENVQEISGLNNPRIEQVLLSKSVMGKKTPDSLNRFRDYQD